MNQGKKLKVKKAAATSAVVLMILSMISFMGIVGGATAGTVDFDKDWYILTDHITVTIEDEDEDKPVAIENEERTVNAGEKTLNLLQYPGIVAGSVVVKNEAHTIVYTIAQVNVDTGLVTLVSVIDAGSATTVHVDYTYDGTNYVYVDIRDADGVVLVDNLECEEVESGKFVGTTTETISDLVTGFGLANEDTIYAIYIDKGPSGTRYDTARIDLAAPVMKDEEPVDYINTKRPTISFKLEDPEAPGDGSALDWDTFTVFLTEDGESPEDIEDDGSVVNGVFTYTPTSDLAEDLHTMDVEIEDNAGNIGSDSFQFTVKVIPPSIAGIDVDLSEDVVYADDSATSQITVQLIDNMGFPILETGMVVDISTNLGQFDEVTGYEDPWTVTGIYKSDIRSKDRKTGIATVIVNVAGFTETLQVTFIPSPMELIVQPGWNLVSVVRAAADPTVAGVFGTDGKVSKVYSYQEGWTTANWDGSAWIGTLTSIEDGDGYWVWCTEDSETTLTIPLKVMEPWEVPPTYDLDAGWNLIGYTNLKMEESDYTEYFYSLTKDANPIWVSAYFYGIGGYTLVKPTSPPYVIDSGQGCWIYLTEVGTLVP